MPNVWELTRGVALDLEPAAQTLNQLVESLLFAFLVPTFKLALTIQLQRTNLTKFTILATA